MARSVFLMAVFGPAPGTIWLLKIFFFLHTDELRGFNTSTESTARRCKKKKSCREQGASCKRAENRPNTKGERQATEHVGKRGLQKERQLGVDVGIQRPKDGDVAHNELRHDTTSSLRIDEQEGEVQKQQAQQPCERFAR